jgi:hypothetical protein
MEQEFVIGGYTPVRRGFDSLLADVYDKKELIFVAKVKKRIRSANPGRGSSRLSRHCKSLGARLRTCLRKGPPGGANR